MDSMEAQLPASVKAVLDKQEIHDVVMRYCRGVDRYDRELIASVFHEDAEYDLGSLQLHGAAEIADRLSQGRRRGGMHFVGNVLIEVDGDVAICESYWISFSTMERDGEDFSRTRAARSVDRFERREDGVWRIAARKAVDEWSRLDRVVETAAASADNGRPFPDDEVYQAARR